MRKIQETFQAQSTTDQDVMYIAFELSNSTWRLAFSDGNKKRHVTNLDCQWIYSVRFCKIKLNIVARHIHFT
jgi:hypothetical protein